MIICCTASSDYIDTLRSLLYSINTNSPGVDILVRLINCTDSETSIVKSEFNNISIIREQYNCSTRREKLCRNGAVLQDTIFDTYDTNRSQFKGARWLYSEFMAKCINDRYTIISKLLNDGHDHVLSIDADTIIRKDLKDMVTECKPYDICLHAEIVLEGKHIEFGQEISLDHVPVLSREDYLLKESTHPPYNYVEWHTGVVLFNNTTVTKNFVMDYDNILAKPENIYTWGAEEEEVYYLYTEKYANKIKLYNLPIKFKDEGYGTDRVVGSNAYSKDSYIWVGAGQNKYNADTDFVKELKLYENSNRLH